MLDTVNPDEHLVQVPLRANLWPLSAEPCSIESAERRSDPPASAIQATGKPQPQRNHVKQRSPNNTYLPRRARADQVDGIEQVVVSEDAAAVLRRAGELAIYTIYPVCIEWVRGFWAADAPLTGTEHMHVFVVPSHRNLQHVVQLRQAQSCGNQYAPPDGRRGAKQSDLGLIKSCVIMLLLAGLPRLHPRSYKGSSCSGSNEYPWYRPAPARNAADWSLKIKQRAG